MALYILRSLAAADPGLPLSLARELLGRYLGYRADGSAVCSLTSYGFGLGSLRQGYLSVDLEDVDLFLSRIAEDCVGVLSGGLEEVALYLSSDDLVVRRIAAARLESGI